MPLFTDFERDREAECGVMWDDFVRALAVWVYCNESGERRPTVADAALAFNTTPELVREAIGEHIYLYLGADDTIESDGA